MALVLAWLLGVALGNGPLQLVLGGSSVTAEVADDPKERAVGLMGRTQLPENHGMIFVYPDEQVRSFWMKNTPIPLSIAFMDRLGRVVHLAELTPNELTPVSSEVPAMYALEMSAGWFKSHDVVIGQPVAGLPAPGR